MQQDYWTIATATPLLLCSVIALALTVERLVAMVQLRSLNKGCQAQLAASIGRDDLDASMQLLTQSQPFYHPAVARLQRYANQEKSLRDEAVTIALEQVSQRLLKRLSAINTIGALAPMLGLLGTIIGLMRSFHNIGLSQGPVEPAMVADGLWQALSTTAVGMIIAVFCVFFSALLRSSAKRKLSAAATTLSQLSLLMAANSPAKVGHD
ncbi:MotA/TolQ/ExbB proton channel family protein [uncultured Ferrimonas sp.]|uniref:MotA/TolQ/ExbB proton channel family protein n=1 Tax=uncultured Ferrimonas sp. TaxID=432640 RepID=UPI0026377A8E|nr:MotA/TolQ/ExbB proton channel family protein [uncultured Ferrimonas sp.]